MLTRHLHLVEEVADSTERPAAHEEEPVFLRLCRTQDRARLEMMAGWVHNATALGPSRPHPHALRRLAGPLATGPAFAVLDRMPDAGRRLLER